MSDEVISANS